MTCSRAIRESASSGISEGSASGSSRCQTATGRRSRNSAAPMRVSWWRVPKAREVEAASGSSSLAQPGSKPIEKVRTGSSLASAMNDSTALESRPPERKQPRGTSLTSRRSTARRMSPSTSSAARSSVRGELRAVRRRHQRRISTPSRVGTIRCPAGSWRTSRNIVRGAGT